jgi:hypothetical protein
MLGGDVPETWDGGVYRRWTIAKVQRSDGSRKIKAFDSKQYGPTVSSDLKAWSRYQKTMASVV